MSQGLRSPTPVGRLERQTLRMTIRTLETRAEAQDPVRLSPQFCRLVARLLRKLSEAG